MPNRTVLVVLTIALCASVALGAYFPAIGKPGGCLDALADTIDVAVEAVSPTTSEDPGLVTIAFKLTNVGNVSALVPRLDVKIDPSGYRDYRENIPIGIGANQVVTLVPWVYLGGTETCTAYITYPEDMNHHNDTAVVIVQTGSALDVETQIVSPTESETTGLVPVAIKLTNQGDTAALVPRLDVRIQPTGYMDYRENIVVAVGESTVVAMSPWVFLTGGTEICTAYITYPADLNHHNDTDVVIVNPSGISGRVEMEPYAGTSLTLLPSPLAGNVLHVEYSLNQAGPAAVTLFDISGRPAVTRRFVAARAGELPLDLRSLNAGVYLVRLDDGHRSLVQKLVVQH